MKDFGEFVVIAMDVIERKVDKRQTTIKLFRTLQLLYRDIILDKRNDKPGGSGGSDGGDITIINKYLLDFETFVDDIPNDKRILVTSNNIDIYCFSFAEIMDCFHSDLSRHYVEEHMEYRVSSLIKNFRQPYHPYCNRPFTQKEIQQIISSMAYQDISFRYPIRPEVFLFLQYFEFILHALENKSSYETTSWLNDFFLQKNLVFQEHVPNSNDYHWIALSHQTSFTFRDFLLFSFFPLYSIFNK